jgi:saccharopine dehydrogenase (NAD+, L-lysine forming)
MSDGNGSGPVIGVVGAYGATGRVVTQALLSQNENPLVLIGRNEAALRELAAGANGRVRIAVADVMDDASLAGACRGCRVVVNCAAPSSVIQDRVARVALQARAHYVDAGGDERLFGSLTGRIQEINGEGLIFLLGAGYVPGLSEMMVRAAYEVHRGAKQDECNVRLFVVDRNEWSLNGFVDMLDHFFRTPPEIGVYRKGVFRHTSMIAAAMRRRLPGQSKSEVLMPVRWPEIDQFAREVQPQQVAVYLPIDPVLYIVGRVLSRFLPTRPGLAGSIAKAIFRFKAKRHGGGGLLYVEASGRKDRHPLRWFIETLQGHHYEVTGQVAALAAALVADGTIAAPGVRYLAHAVDPHDFIVRLRSWGVETVDIG